MVNMECGNGMDWIWWWFAFGRREGHEVHDLDGKMGELGGDRLNYFLRSFAMMALT